MNYIYVHKVDTYLLQIVNIQLIKDNALYVSDYIYKCMGLYMYSFSVCRVFNP